ncbi:hypothetical protein SLA2020_150490 [Shorea laevis]
MGRELEVNLGEIAIENILNRSKGKKDDRRQLCVGSANNVSQSNSVSSPRHGISMLGQGLLNHIRTKPTCGEKEELGNTGTIKRGISKRVQSDLQPERDSVFSKGESSNRNLEEGERNKVENRQNQEEKDRSTQPFWEGLASEDEILQSRLERLARDRNRKRQMERRMRQRMGIKRQKKESKN